MDIFAWSYKDLKGIPAHIELHMVRLELETIPIQS